MKKIVLATGMLFLIMLILSGRIGIAEEYNPDKEMEKYTAKIENSTDPISKAHFYTVRGWSHYIKSKFCENVNECDKAIEDYTMLNFLTK